MQHFSHFKIVDKKHPNVVSMQGGKWFIPSQVYPSFMEMYLNTCESKRMTLCETAGLIQTRLFLDIDFKSDRNAGQLNIELDMIAGDIFYGVHHAHISFCDSSHGCHVIFPTIVIPRGHLKSIMKRFKDHIPEVDLQATSLRLVGSYSYDKRLRCFSKSPYMPLSPEMSLHPTIGQELTKPLPTLMALQSMTGIKHRTLHEMPVPWKMVRRAMVVINNFTIDGFKQPWSKLKYDTVKNVKKYGVCITVKGQGQTFCMIKGSEHQNNRISFNISPNGIISQQCFNQQCKGKYVLGNVY